MTTRPPASSGPSSLADASGLLRATLVVLAAGFAFTAVGSVWTILTPDGTGVNFPAGLLYLLGMAVGVLGLVLAVVALVVVARVTKRS